MYLLLDLCSSSGVLRLFYILKLLLNIIFIIVPLIVIGMSTADFFKVVISGKSDTMKSTLLQSFKRIIAGIIVFFIPTLMNTLFEYLVDMNLEFGTCITNATLEGIKAAEQEEAEAIKDEREAIIEELESYEEIQKAKQEESYHFKSKYSKGDSLEEETLTSGTSATYFAPLQNGSKGGGSASLTGGCSNTSPVYHDVSASIGTPVYAPYDGVAKYIQSNCNGILYSFGNQVRVFKEDGTYITYAHFSKFPDGIEMPITQDCPYKSSSGSKCGAGHCSAGMTSTQIAEVTVKKGQLIGYTGTTGNSLGPHLHVEIHEKGSSSCVTDPWAAFGMR